MRKINLTKKLVDAFNEEIGINTPCLVLNPDEKSFKKDPKGKDIIVYKNVDDHTKTLKDAILLALVKPDVIIEDIQGKKIPRAMNKEEKLTRFRLWEKIKKSDKTISLKEEELNQIDEAINKNEADPLIYGQCYDLLFGK